MPEHTPLSHTREAHESLDETGDEALLAQARRDRQAFAPLYARYITPVFQYCYRRLGSREEAEDAASLVSGGHATVIVNMGMDRATFFSVVRTLVNGHRQAAAIRSAQRDLDALHLPSNNSY